MNRRGRRSLSIVVSITVLLLLTSLTHGITNGMLDGNRHANVGLVVTERDGRKITPCSGSLIAPTVFVTAAHCVAFIQSIGATQVWVTFDSHADLATSPLIPGTLYPNPAFDGYAPDPNDVAVITFATPVEGITPVELPTAGLLDELSEMNGLKDQTFTVVGYGVHELQVGGGKPVFLRDLNRRFAISDLNAVEPALLRLSKVEAQGNGGASRGDSGGPIFIGDSATVAAIVAAAFDEAMYVGYRLDIASARAFLSNFVTVP